jgi:hypothetical protein
MNWSKKVEKKYEGWLTAIKSTKIERELQDLIVEIHEDGWEEGVDYARREADD